MTEHKAAILLVGNQLLSGKVADENSYFLTRELHKLGIQVWRIVVVPDEIDEIVEALRDLRGRVEFVFTSGGIGPTHDDVTVEAIAKALERPLVVDAKLKERVHQFFGDKLTAAHLKMATIPKGSTLVESTETRFPALVVDDVYVLAGVPKIMRRGFVAVRQMLPIGTSRSVATLYITTDEWTLAPILEDVVRDFPDVQLGSYPVLGEPTYKVRVTLEGDIAAQVEQALYHLIERLPAGDIVRTERP